MSQPVFDSMPVSVCVSSLIIFLPAVVLETGYHSGLNSLWTRHGWGRHNRAAFEREARWLGSLVAAAVGASGLERVGQAIAADTRGGFRADRVFPECAAAGDAIRIRMAGQDVPPVWCGGGTRLPRVISLVQRARADHLLTATGAAIH